MCKLAGIALCRYTKKALLKMLILVNPVRTIYMYSVHRKCTNEYVLYKRVGQHYSCVHAHERRVITVL